jgi:hypothetical protein
VIDHALEPRANRFALRSGIDYRLAKRELKELCPLERIELQHTGQIVQSAG